MRILFPIEIPTFRRPYADVMPIVKIDRKKGHPGDGMALS
jgi:hypothetical protein